jgi:Ca-activated chloride channel family protein
MLALLIAVIATMASVPLAQQRDGNPFSIAVNVELVVFNVTVVDAKGHHIAGLKSSDFRVSEDGRPLNIRFFEAGDAPASVGLLIDNSGSMRNKRGAVHEAALDFVNASSARDEMFVLYFDERVHMGLPSGIAFTNDVNRMRSVFDGMAPGGKTALYDALAAGLAHIASGTRERRALIVFSDGGDNASRHRLDDVLQTARGSSATIYTIGMYDADDPDKNPGVLRKIAETSGGRAYFPKSLKDNEKVWGEIAGEIRSQYTIGFLPGRAVRNGEFRNVKVEVGSRRNLSVITRKGYALPASADSAEFR